MLYSVSSSFIKISYPYQKLYTALKTEAFRGTPRLRGPAASAMSQNPSQAPYQMQTFRYGAMSWMNTNHNSRQSTHGIIYACRKKRKVHWVKTVLFPQAIPRSSFIVWLAVKDRLATGTEQLDGVQCRVVFCRERVETKHHLYFPCPFTLILWSTICVWYIKLLSIWFGRCLEGAPQAPMGYLLSSIRKVVNDHITSLHYSENSKLGKLLIRSNDCSVFALKSDCVTIYKCKV
ncbi:hypothetical protein V5N11_021647 [Cardamine amara subsp. amara]|uniref:Reverse transcriptase zinc-binding domain-containing protein n=1 Tax=Cardamine amara subsp. amara TaxID=228776 RepID=A0ABD1AB19_CARAN